MDSHPWVKVFSFELHSTFNFKKPGQRIRSIFYRIRLLGKLKTGVEPGPLHQHGLWFSQEILSLKLYRTSGFQCGFSEFQNTLFDLKIWLNVLLSAHMFWTFYTAEKSLNRGFFFMFALVRAIYFHRKERWK